MRSREVVCDRATARRDASSQYRGSGPGGASEDGDEWALSVFNDNDKNRNGFLDPSEQAGTAFGKQEHSSTQDIPGYISTA